MPELPEVEILVRHLAPLLKGKKIREVEVRRAKVLGRDFRARTDEGIVRRDVYGIIAAREIFVV